MMAKAANIPERKTERRIRGQARSYKIFIEAPDCRNGLGREHSRA